MNIALMAHDNKKELMVQFCTAYCGILAKHTLCATARTGQQIAEATGLTIHRFLSFTHGGGQQIAARIAYNEIDMVLCFSDPNQGAGSANLIADRNMAQAIGVIYDASDAYSSGIYDSFMEVAATKGLNVVCETSFTADSKSDLSTQVAQCKDAGADLVFLPFYYTEAAQVLVQANKIGYKPTFFGCDGMDGILDVEGFDTALAEGLMMMTPFAADAEDEATQSFVAKYKEKTGGVPNQFAADAYDVVYALYKACTAAGIDGTTPNAEACDKLIEQFTTMSFDGLTGKGMTWDSNGFVSKVPTAVKIENGAYVGIG